MKDKIIFFVLLGGFLLSAPLMAQQEDYVAQGKKGIEAFSRGNLIEALDLLNRSAEKGYAPAQSTLAYILDKADDDNRAFELYSKAAEQGDANGQYGLAGMLAKGEGAEKNVQLAGQWMLKSATQQHTLAMRDYAVALERGELGLERNLSKALNWYRKCSDAGDGVCTRRLANAYKWGELGLAADAQKSAELFQQINEKKESKQ